MAFKRPLSTSPPSQRNDSNTTVTKPDDPRKSTVCLICGDKARIINYGALSCQSCKTFFRRNGYRPETVRPCSFNKSCEINMQTRHSCTACRLAKCFSMGMSSDFIRKEDNKKLKNSPTNRSNNDEQVTSKQLTTTLQLLTSDTSQGDRSLLFDSQWKLLSNIEHAYDKYSTITQMRHTIDNLSTLTDESHINVINPLEIISQMCTSMRLFISSSPDFQILTLSEQSSLIERNLHGVIGFYSTQFFHHTGVLHSPQYLNAFITIYGSDIILSAKNVTTQLDPDSTIAKIVLLIFAFSSTCLVTHESIERDSLLYGTFRLLGSQNVYVELLWKYMIYQYGYNEAALRFTRLIQIFLCVMKNLAIAHTNSATHRKMLEDVVEKTKQTLVISTNEHTPLWGKTLLFHCD